MSLHILLQQAGKVLRVHRLPSAGRRISGVLFQQSSRSTIRPQFRGAEEG
ncbi:MAG: hypothetical protein FWG84_07435 [Bacteroidales bacterium]|nr:hypothetical protein [Bacteroidales bacterium]